LNYDLALLEPILDGEYSDGTEDEKLQYDTIIELIKPMTDYAWELGNLLDA